MAQQTVVYYGSRSQNYDIQGELGQKYFSGSTITKIEIGESVTSIGFNAFRSCLSLSSITIPNTVVSIGQSAFDGCPKLISIIIPNSVTDIGLSAFWHCSGLTSVTLSENLTEIKDDTFISCSKLESITIPNSVTRVGLEAFRYCSGITSVTLGSGLKNIGQGAFADCVNLTSVTIPNNVEVFEYNSSSQSLTQGVFEDCTSLTSVYFENGFTKISGPAFAGCTSLTSVTIPNSVTSIGYGAFRYVPTQGDLYCDENWYNNLSSTNKTNLGNVYNWRRHDIEITPILSSTTTTEEYCNGYDWTRDTTVHYYSGYSESTLVEYSSSTTTSVLEHNSVEHCGYQPTIYSSTTTTEEYCNGYDWTRDTTVHYLSGYSDSTLVEYSAKTTTSVLEHNSVNHCGYIPEDIVIKNENKYSLYRKQITRDGGQTWLNTNEYYAELKEENSPDCRN